MGVLSGIEWVGRFPASASIDDLSEPFRTKAQRFLEALRSTNASVIVEGTLRPPERAYLMHYCFGIARKNFDPRAVPPRAGVDIEWVHRDGEGNPDLAASKAAAEEMTKGYGIVYEPVLKSRHTSGLAVDMTIRWEGALTIASAGGGVCTIVSGPRTGAGNPELHKIGASYGVFKLLSDPPHWSSDGH